VVTPEETIYDAAFALADVAWNAGYRYDAADLALSMSGGSTSGEILPELDLELGRQARKRWVTELGTAPDLERLRKRIREAFRSVGQPPPRD
jgi:hypothetical protein